MNITVLSDSDSDIFHDALEHEIESERSYSDQYGILDETSTNPNSFIPPKEMPSSPPPPPPISPMKSTHHTKETSKKTKKVKGIDTDPSIISDHDRLTTDENQTITTTTTNNTKKKKKSKKTKKKQKEPKTKSNIYEKQYKTSAITNDHSSIPTHPSTTTSWFQFWEWKQNSNVQNNTPYDNTQFFATRYTNMGRRKVNIGELNSAHGEGTTVPQLLTRVRYMTFFLALCTTIMESWAFLFQLVSLKTDKIIMGFYLMFFVGLLVCYEIVRGQPRPGSFVDGNWTDLGVFQELDIAELAWKTVLQSKLAKRIRYFLQENFGILYSCWGRGIYLCFVGGIALGQGILWMGKLVGSMFFMFGIWTISLKYRNPLFEKALIMDLDHEFKNQDRYQKYEGDGIVTWTSLRSRINNNVGERQRLIKGVRTSHH